MKELLARFDRGPLEEIRLSLMRQRGRAFLDLRVHGVPASGKGEPFPGLEGITVPVELFPKLRRAIQAVDEALRRRGLLPAETPVVTQMVGGDAVEMPPPGAHLPDALRGPTSVPGRVSTRVALDCPVEYIVRGRPAREGQPAGPRSGRIKDLSRTGAQVVLPERVPLLSVLHITLHLPAGTISLPCEVVWAQLSGAGDIAREGCRHGVHFTQVGPREAKLLDQQVTQLGG